MYLEQQQQRPHLHRKRTYSIPTLKTNTTGFLDLTDYIQIAKVCFYNARRDVHQCPKRERKRKDCEKGIPRVWWVLSSDNQP